MYLANPPATKPAASVSDSHGRRVLVLLSMTVALAAVGALAGLTGRVLERAGCPIHYWVGGPDDRPWVVFMHGATMDRRMFNRQVEALLPTYRVLGWDARGQGVSQPIGDAFTLELDPLPY